MPRGIENVTEELIFRREQYDAEELYIVDDRFGFFEEFTKMHKPHNLRIFLNPCFILNSAT